MGKTHSSEAKHSQKSQKHPKISKLTIRKKIKRAAASKSLSLAGAKLKAIPPTVLDITDLRILELQGNKVTTLGDDFCRLLHLRVLNLSENSLVTLPSGFVRLTTLHEISLTNNPIDDSAVQHLPSTLTKLDLCGTRISGAAPLQSLAALKILSIAHCGLEDIPPAVGELVNLEDLDVSSNKIQSFAGVAWKNLPRLLTIDAKDNRLTSHHTAWPEELFKETHVHSMRLTGNNLTQDQVLALPGVQAFLERRKQRIAKHGLASTTLEGQSLCGL